MQYDQINALNWSTLRHLDVSPLLLRHRVANPEPETPALRLGRAIHCAVLEPDAWRTRYAARPDLGDGRTNAGKAARAAWADRLATTGAIDLSAEDHALAEACAAAVRAHRRAAPLLSDGRAEEVVTWTDEPTGLACKGRIDYVAPGRLVDLKSTRRERPRMVAHDAANFLYHAQLAWYLDGAIAARVLPADAAAYMISVQNEEPHDVCVFDAGAGIAPALSAGRAVYRRLLKRYVECQAADWWPGAAPDVLPLELPRWAAELEENGGDETF